nr:hypothetical protein DA06_10185 [Georgenia sp. SUBG003]
MTQAAKDALTVRRVFGEAYVSGDATVIPVAKVMGGSGMGYGGAHPGPGGSDGEDAGVAGDGRHAAGMEGEGGGGGFGVRVKPAGVYVVRGGDVQWQPALDVNRLALGGQLLVAVAVLAWALRRRR